MNRDRIVNNCMPVRCPCCGHSFQPPMIGERDYGDIRRIIREMSERGGYSRAEIAEAAGCPLQFVTNVRKGGRYPPMRTAMSGQWSPEKERQALYESHEGRGAVGRTAKKYGVNPSSLAMHTRRAWNRLPQNEQEKLQAMRRGG